MARVFVNGHSYEPDDARISVFDHGLVVGDGVFETVALLFGRAFALSRHVARLRRSAEGLGISGLSDEAVQAAVGEVVETCEFETGRIRITVTSGSGPLGSQRGGDAPTLVVAAEPYEADGHPASVALVPWTRNEHGALAGLKTISYAENARALAWAHEQGADEAIFANTAGALCEGTGSNVFVVRGGVLSTPPLRSGCLDGVTRALVLERHGGAERDLPAAEFTARSLDEAFLTSTLRGVQPIARIDGVDLAQVGGPETDKASAAYATAVASADEP